MGFEKLTSSFCGLLLSACASVALPPGFTSAPFALEAQIREYNAAGLRVMGGDRSVHPVISVDEMVPSNPIPLTLLVQANRRGIELRELYIDLERSGILLGRSPNLLPGPIVANESLTVSAIIPPIRLARKEGDLSVVVRAVAFVDGGRRLAAGRATFDGHTTFEPLFNSQRVTTNPRFSTRDIGIGGDSWASHSAIVWLNSHATLPFNDITSMHGATLANGRSILGHSGHADGLEIDLRYANGRGGFDGPLSGAPTDEAPTKYPYSCAKEARTGSGARRGAGILALMETADDRLADWVIANRRVLSDASLDAEEILVGDCVVWRALDEGLVQGADNVRIVRADGSWVGAWRGRPGNIRPSRGHLDHWHIRLKRRHGLM